MFVKRITVGGLLCATALAGGGCGSPGDRPELGLVSGTVTLDGEPLPNAAITFTPDQGRLSAGDTDAEGRYELLYLRGVKGAKVGHHEVIITTSMDPTDVNWDPARSRERVPPWYNVRSSLEATVEPGENVIDFRLTTEPPEEWRRDQ